MGGGGTAAIAAAVIATAAAAAVAAAVAATAAVAAVATAVVAVAAAFATPPTLVNGDLHPLTHTGPSFRPLFTLAAARLYVFALISIQSRPPMRSGSIQSRLLVFAIVVPAQLARLTLPRLSSSSSIRATGCVFALVSM
jgi:hypothetical protein